MDTLRRPAADPGALSTQVNARRLDPLTRARKWAIDRMVAARNRRAELALRAMPALWGAMTDYAQGSAVTGASFSDYLTLYEQMRARRPTEVLECGTGISTVVMAHALQENAREGTAGRITSMEEDAGWHATACERLPGDLAQRIDMVHSPKVDGCYKCFRGVQYLDVPDRPCDFVFSDGPEQHSPVTGDKLFDLDLIHIARRAERPLYAVVDNHYLTFYVLQKVFGLSKARYSVSHKLMFVGPVTKADVRHLEKESFLADLRVFGTTELKLRMALDD